MEIAILSIMPLLERVKLLSLSSMRQITDICSVVSNTNPH